MSEPTPLDYWDRRTPAPRAAAPEPDPDGDLTGWGSLVCLVLFIACVIWTYVYVRYWVDPKQDWGGIEAFFGTLYPGICLLPLGAFLGLVGVMRTRANTASLIGPILNGGILLLALLWHL